MEKMMENPYEAYDSVNRSKQLFVFTDAVMILFGFCFIWTLVHREVFGISRIWEETILWRLIPLVGVCVLFAYLLGFRSLSTTIVSASVLTLFALVMLMSFVLQSGA
jgi:small-conductance mechanosensitive channel